MGMGLYIGWFVILIVSEIVADIHISRKGGNGFLAGFLGIIGAFLSWAFIPVYRRVIEVPGYVHSEAFSFAVGVGFLGVLFFLLSCFSLRKNSFLARQGGVA